MDEQMEDWFSMCPPHRSLLQRGQLEDAGNCLACIRNERDSLRRALAAVLAKYNPVYFDGMKRPRPLYVCDFCEASADPRCLDPFPHRDDCPLSAIADTCEKLNRTTGDQLR